MVGQARILSPKEVKNIFQLLPSARDKAIFAIGIYTGLRVGEIVTLRADQLFTEAGNVRNVLKVKRKKKKTLSTATFQCMRN
jgi:integrase